MPLLLGVRQDDVRALHHYRFAGRLLLPPEWDLHLVAA
jgi:hypothetical protein